MRIRWSILSLIVTAQPMVGVCGHGLLHPPGRGAGTTPAALSQSEKEEEGEELDQYNHFFHYFPCLVAGGAWTIPFLPHIQPWQGVALFYKPLRNPKVPGIPQLSLLYAVQQFFCFGDCPRGYDSLGLQFSGVVTWLCLSGPTLHTVP